MVLKLTNYFNKQPPVAQWPEEGRENIRGDLQPLAAQLWPEKFHMNKETYQTAARIERERINALTEAAERAQAQRIRERDPAARPRLPRIRNLLGG